MKKQHARKARTPALKDTEPTGLRTGYHAQPEIKPRNADGLVPLHMHDDFNTVVFCKNPSDARRAIPRYTRSLKNVGRLNYKPPGFTETPVKGSKNELGELPDIIGWYDL